MSAAGMTNELSLVLLMRINTPVLLININRKLTNACQAPSCPR